MTTTVLDIGRLRPAATRPFADAAKVARYAPFDWVKYTPITVLEDKTGFTIQDGMTRVELARQAGITKLPAYIFKR
jgi:hypothetical protein